MIYLSKCEKLKKKKRRFHEHGGPKGQKENSKHGTTWFFCPYFQLMGLPPLAKEKDDFNDKHMVKVQILE